MYLVLFYKPFYFTCIVSLYRKDPNTPKDWSFDEPNDLVRILSEMEKYTSNINFDGSLFDHWNDHRERDTNYHKSKKISFLFRLVKK